MGKKGGEKWSIRPGLCALVLSVQKDVPLGSVRSCQAVRACRKPPSHSSLEYTVEKIAGSAGLRKCLHQFEVAQLGPLISHYPAEKTNLSWNSHAG